MGEGLGRFRDAQRADFGQALAEVRAGRKRSHWMWYVFPQIHGLGRSGISRHYAIRSLQEARDYLADPVLGAHLVEMGEALLALPTSDPHQVFGSPDDLKLLSCMTLFERAGQDGKAVTPGVGRSAGVFSRVIDKFYGGRRDERTLEILRHEAPAELRDRDVYDTPIGPVCMSRAEHDAYLEEQELHEVAGDAATYSVEKTRGSAKRYDEL